MIILAIDPGVTGALAFYIRNPSGISGLQIACDMPVIDGDVNPHALRDIITARLPDLAVIELVAPMPKEGVRSVWRFSAAFTTARVVVALLEIPTVLVAPSKWKRSLGLTGGKDGKEECRRRAIDLFPTCQSLFARKKDHGRAEAALLAVYAAQLNEARNYE